MDFVGSGCEKTKHHLNPSPKRPKTLPNQKQKTGETLPTEPAKDKKKIASRTTNLQAAGNMSQNKLGLQKTSELVETPKRYLWITLWKREQNATKLSKRSLWNAEKAAFGAF